MNQTTRSLKIKQIIIGEKRPLQQTTLITCKSRGCTQWKVASDLKEFKIKD